MKESDRPLLTAALDELEGVIQEKLSTDSAADVSEELRRADELRRAIGTPPRRRPTDAALSFAVALSCVALIVLALNWRVDAINLGFVIETTGVEVTSKTIWPEPRDAMRLDQSLTVGGVAIASGDIPKVHLLPDELRPVRIDFTPPSASPEVADGLGSTGRYALLSLPTIPEGSPVKVACEPGDIVAFTITGAPMVASISVTGEAFVSGGRLPEGEVLILPDSELLQLTSDDGRPISFRVRKDDAETILAGAVSGVKFLTDQTGTPNLERFASAIQSGHLTVHTVDRGYELDRFDELKLEGVDGATVIEVGTGDCLQVAFEGLAKTATLGKDPTTENIVPTQLAFWFQDRQLPFYLTVFATIWGVLWGGITWMRHRAD